MPRKHLIANKTNKKQQTNARLWQKLANEIKVAASVGGKNPDSNPRLKDAIERALDANLSRDSINKNINGVNNDAKSLVENEYEFFAEGGLKIIVHVLTDNTNRASSNIRGYLSKMNASLAKTNSVKNSFSTNGIFYIESNDLDELTLMELLNEFDLVDVVKIDDETMKVVVKKEDFFRVKKILETRGLDIIYECPTLIPDEPLEADDKLRAKVEKLLEVCDNDPDIQWVVTNIAPF